MLLTVAYNSLLSRKKTVLLTLFSLTISMLVLFSVEHLRLQAKDSFNRTISGTDLIVGAPSGQLNLLLYSVFRLGNATNNIQYESYEMLQQHPLVEWAIPFSLGDSHKGFRVLGTTSEYFRHYKYGNKQPLQFSQGHAFRNLFETVIGSDVAKKLGYQVGDKIVIAHGIGNTSFTKHKDSPFVISGILTPTGTPVDKTVHVSLPAIEAIHLPPAYVKQLVADPDSIELIPKSITSVMLGLTSNFSVFKMQRELNNYQNDRLMAILPGVAIMELWSLVAVIENVLQVIAGLVLISALIGLATMLLASIHERQAEIAVFRVLGAAPRKIMFMIILEAFLLTFSAMLAAIAILFFTLFVSSEWLAREFGLFLTANIMSPELLVLCVWVLFAALITALLPSIEVYRSALNRQLSAN